MKKKTIWAHTLVKNEERYLWFAVMSVIDYVDKVLLWDTGSTDHTLQVIKEIQKIAGDKVEFKEIGEVDINEFTKVRQRMLDETASDWFLIVDGDEVWWDFSIKTLIDLIQEKGDFLEAVISPYYNIVGDIYHYQEEMGGQYKIDGRRGHINIRAVNKKIPGLHLEKPHGQQGFYDGEGTLIQERPKKYREFVDAPYLHFTNMRRSFSVKGDQSVPRRKIKYKYELGNSFSPQFKFPEVFYQSYPKIVISPWIKMTWAYFLRAFPETIIRKLRRKILRSQKIGY